jgi:hypothetical protein
MQLDPIEFGRLAITQRHPSRYTERRVERVELVDDYHYAVTVTQQITTPLHLKYEKNDEPTKMLVSIGWFSKDRLPDLTVYGHDGSKLPLLRRRDQGRILANLFTARWHGTFFSHLPETSHNEALHDEAQAKWRIIQESVAQVVTSGRRGAFVAVYRLERFLQEESIDQNLARELRRSLLNILHRKEFWRYLTDVLAENRLLVSQMPGMPGHTYVVTIKYTERFPYETYGPTPSRISKTLAWLGVIGIPTSRTVANIGHAASLWAIQTVPEGLEPVRCFWKRDANEVRTDDPISVDITSAAAGKHIESSGRVEPDDLILDVQVSASSAIASTAALAGLLYLVSVYVYKAVPPNNSSQVEPTILISLGSIFAAAPAAIAGALAYRGHTFVRHASRGPRLLLGLLSAQAAILAVVVSLHGLSALAEGVAYALSLYSLMIVGIFLFIRFGPRWRKTERSLSHPGFDGDRFCRFPTFSWWV